MGERANILVKSDWSEVCLYTHWMAPELPEILRQALIRGKGRWDDEQYLTRIIFCEMIKDDVMGTTGFGISSKIGDGDSHILGVDVNKQTVTIRAKYNPPDIEIPIAEYVTKERGWNENKEGV